MKSRECSILVFMLSLYSFGSCVAGWLYAGDQNIVLPVIVSIIIMWSSKTLSVSWFDCISSRNVKKHNYTLSQTVFSIFLFLICSIGRGIILPVFLICVMRSFSLETVSYRLYIQQGSGLKTSRRFVIIVPMMFCIMESAATGAALALAVRGKNISLLIEAFILIYAILWDLTLEESTDKVIGYNEAYVIITLIIIFLNSLFYIFNKNLGAVRQFAYPIIDTIAFVFLFSSLSGIPGLLEIIQILWHRKDLGEKKPSDESCYVNYCDQLRIIRIVDMFGVLIVVISWVYLKYSIFAFVLYTLLSTTYVIAFRHHYVRTYSNNEYHGSFLWASLWIVLPTLLVMAEHYHFMPNELPINYDWPSDAITIFVEVICAILAIIRFDNYKDALNAFYNLGLFGTHMIGIAAAVLIIGLGPASDGRKGFALLSMGLSVFFLVMGYILNNKDPIPRREEMIQRHRNKTNSK